jgi:hypothetical protein
LAQRAKPSQPENPIRVIFSAGVRMPNKLSSLIIILPISLLLISPISTHGQDIEKSRQQIESEKLVSPKLYTQPGFAATAHAREFAEWKARFIEDRRVYLETSQKTYHDPKLSDEERELARASARKKAYVNSIDKGKKGQSLVDYMIDAMYSPGSYGTRAGIIVARLIDNKYSRAVGYGGTFQSSGSTVELWYVVFNDMKNMSNSDMRSTSAFSVFSPLELPKLNEVKRNSWPSMIFIRDSQGRLMLWGMSAEQYGIVSRSEEKSMY